MSVCEDYGYIARRLREIENETRHAFGSVQDRSPEQPPTDTTRVPDFNGWFWQLVGATG